MKIKEAATVARAVWRLVFRPEELEDPDDNDPNALAIISVGGTREGYRDVGDAIAAQRDRLGAREVRTSSDLDRVLLDHFRDER
jgi:hypothetical protein